MRVFEGHLVSAKGRFAVCVSRFNSFITEQLLSGALDALKRHGIDEDAIDVYRGPGTVELPGAATVGEALEQAWAASAEEGPRDEEAHAFALELVKGVREQLAEVDALIQKHSLNWKLDRMSRIDRNVLRLGVYELKFRD